MFENANFDWDDDDVILGTSFSSVNSTQTCSLLKRHSEEIDKENLKRSKLSNKQTSTSPKCESFATASNKFIETSINASSKAIKRKFPGPAGLLPERTECEAATLDVFSHERYKYDDRQDHLLLCSQRTVSVFEEGPWKEMKKDFFQLNGDCPYNKYNIGWIKKQATILKQLVNHKAPFLAAIIQNLEIFDHKVPVINVTLKDATGEIQGTVLHSLYEKYSNLFTIGSVLVLKEFGVLSTGYNNHCLTITHNNLVIIYCLETPKEPPNSGVITVDRCSVVTKVVIQNCCIDNIIGKYEKDILSNEQKNKSINFRKIYHNHELLQNSDNADTLHMLHSKKLQEENKTKTNNFLRPLIKHSFNKTNSVNNINPSISIETVPKVIPKVIPQDTSKKKFNFRRTECAENFVNVTDIQTVTLSQDVCAVNDNIIVLETNCNVSNRRSQNLLSVRPDSKEHTEIWRNVLEGVDTDSLFEDF